jgi:hypothetical protein
MQERLSTARDPNVVKVLQAMRDFVVSFEWNVREAWE